MFAPDVSYAVGDTPLGPIASAGRRVRRQRRQLGGQGEGISRDEAQEVVDLRRGQEAGEFDRQLSTDWLIAATINLGHAAGEAVGDGRLSKPEADDALRTSLLRILTPGPTR